MKWLRLKQYLENSSIHGFKHLVQNSDYHWVERLFWLVVCGLSWYCCALLIVRYLEQFINHPIDITPETSYLNWKTAFPSLAFCTVFSKEADDYAIKIINSHGLNGRRFSKRLILDSTAGYVAELDGLLTAEDLTTIYSKIKLNCSNIFTACSWNQKPFDCCDEFGLLQSPAGFCYMFNSIHGQFPNKQSSIKFFVDRTSKHAYLSINFTEKFKNWHRNSDVKVYFLNNYDIPTITSSDSKDVKKLDKITGIDFTMEDIVNDDDVKNLLPNKRGCLFSDENDHNSVYKYYSYEGCSIDSVIKRMIKSCGCVSFRYPRNPHMPVCNMTEMLCIFKFKEKFMVHECLPDCDGSFIYPYQWKSPNQTANEGGLRIKMLSTPFVRFRRYIRRTTLDLIVSVGSVIGLFTGASILSFVEIIYWFFIH